MTYCVIVFHFRPNAIISPCPFAGIPNYSKILPTSVFETQMNANSLHIIYQPVYFSQKAPKESKDKEEVKEKSPEPKKEKAAKKQQAESPAKQEKVEKKEQKSQNNKATSVYFFSSNNIGL